MPPWKHPKTRNPARCSKQALDRVLNLTERIGSALDIVRNTPTSIPTGAKYSFHAVRSPVSMFLDPLQRASDYMQRHVP